MSTNDPIFSEKQIMFLANYFFTAQSHRVMVQELKETVKPVEEIAHQLRTNNTDVQALHGVFSDWSYGLWDPWVGMVEDLLDMWGTEE